MNLPTKKARRKSVERPRMAKAGGAKEPKGLHMLEKRSLWPPKESLYVKHCYCRVTSSLHHTVILFLAYEKVKYMMIVMLWREKKEKKGSLLSAAVLLSSLFSCFCYGGGSFLTLLLGFGRDGSRLTGYVNKIWGGGGGRRKSLLGSSLLLVQYIQDGNNVEKKAQNFFSFTTAHHMHYSLCI